MTTEITRIGLIVAIIDENPLELRKGVLATSCTRKTSNRARASGCIAIQVLNSALFSIMFCFMFSFAQSGGAALTAFWLTLSIITQLTKSNGRQLGQHTSIPLFGTSSFLILARFFYHY